MFSDSSVTLIDFGLCEKYVDGAGLHIKDTEEVSQFKGNLLFSTVR